MVWRRQGSARDERKTKLMQFLRRFAQGELRLTRIEAFSDGVFAIVITLLVLELKVPALQDHGSVSELTHDLLELLPRFLNPAAPHQA